MSERAGTFAPVTAPGPAAIAIVRVAGPGVPEFWRRHLRTRRGADDPAIAAGAVLRGRLVDENGEPVDDVLLSIHARPATGSCPRDAPPIPVADWDVRLHLHGGAGVVQRCGELLAAAGFRPADSAAPPGDAILFGEHALPEREASALLPQTLTLAGAAWLLRQPRALEELLRQCLADLDRRGDAALPAVRAVCAAAAARFEIVRWFTRPLRVAVVGPPNAGKSTLINALCARPVSLVSAEPGTTRDWVEALDEIEGYPVVWIDTAGLRDAKDEIEAEGIRRARRARAEADRAVLVLDSSPDAAAASAAFVRLGDRLTPDVVVMNKCDLLAEANAAGGLGSSTGSGFSAALERLPAVWRRASIRAVATQGVGVDALRRSLMEASGRSAADLAHPAAFTPRQAGRLATAASAATSQPARAALLDCLGEN